MQRPNILFTNDRSLVKFLRPHCYFAIFRGFMFRSFVFRGFMFRGFVLRGLELLPYSSSIPSYIISVLNTYLAPEIRQISESAISTQFRVYAAPIRLIFWLTHEILEYLIDKNNGYFTFTMFLSGTQVQLY